MSVYPHVRLFPSSTKTVVISGPHIQVLDSTSGATVCTTTAFDEEQKTAILKSGPIRCAAVDSTSTHLATAGDDKKLNIWAIDDLQLINERELPKKPTQISFTCNQRTILVSDKFGDIFSYPLIPDPAASQKDAPKAEGFASHENPSGGKLILGHTSLLSAFALTQDEQFIVSADRDEHVRVSWFPQGYCIESYCLGHKKFVSAVHIPAFAPETLVSGGGDPALKVWDWKSGRLLREIRAIDAVMPFIAVRVKKRKWRDEDEDEGEGEEKKPRGRMGKRKNKSKQKEVEAGGVEAAMEETEQDDGAEAGEQDRQVSEIPGASQPPEEPVFVLQKIDTVDVGGQQWLVFSAVGSTALFWSSFLPSSTTTPPVQSHDFGKPVLDFVLERDGRVWVLLDAEWTAPGPEASSGSSSLVRLMQLSTQGLADVEAPSRLLSTLNTSRIAATPTELAALELYDALASMPKNVDASHNPMDRDAPPEGGRKFPHQRKGAKEMGKMKTRKAILEAQGTRDGTADMGEEREVKKARSEGEEGDKDVVVDKS